MLFRSTFYITTPIYYPSDKLHIGHSYTTVACDALARFKRMQGKEVMFLTGTDEHGQKIQDKAADAGVTPKEYVDKIVATVKDLWKLLDVSYDRFIRTTDDYHMESCQKIFTKLYEQGDIYKGFRALGADVKIEHGLIKTQAEHLRGSHIYMDVVSVGATINIMMAAVMAEGTTIIENSAKEPHVVRSEEHTSELQSR